MGRKPRRGRVTAAEPVRPRDSLPIARYAIILAILAAIAYANSLSVPFVFDDADAIVSNRHIVRLWPLRDVLTTPVQSAVAGRPVVNLSLALSYAWNGLSPAAFRVGNIALLMGSALALFGILRRSFRRVAGETASAADWTALAGALIWLLHPLQTEVVDYTIQRTESLMGFFYLLTLYASVRVMTQPHGSRAWTTAAIVACAIGMGCKESMVTAPVMVLLYDLAFEAGDLRTAMTRRRALYVGLAATWLVLAAAIIEAPRFRSAGLSTGVSLWTYLLNQAVMIVTYLKLSVWPHPLVLDYGPTGPIALQAALPYAIVVLALLGATLIAWRIRPALGFLGSWFFITLAPSSSIVPIATEVGAERRMFLPLASVVVLLLLGVRWAWTKWAHRQAGLAWIAGALAAVVLVLGGLTVARNAEYQSSIGIWETVLARRPHPRAHYNLGIALKDAGRTAEAVEQYQIAVTGEPAAYYALGFEAGSAGHFDEAVAHLREFIRLKPDDFRAPLAYYLLGRSLVGQGKHAEAEQAFREILRMLPRDADARLGLADALLAQQRPDEAITMYREFLTMVPRHADAHHNLGIALVARHDDVLALGEFQIAAELNPSDAALRQSFGNALVTADRLDDAIVQFRAGLRLAPNDPQMMSRLALTLAATGDVNESLPLFRRALQLAPNDPDVQQMYAAAMAQWRARH